METQTVREEFTWSAKDRARIERAATLSGTKKAGLMRDLVRKGVDEILASHGTYVLTEKDARAILQAAKKPYNNKLKKALINADTQIFDKT